MSNEIKVGLLLVVALGVLGWLTVASGTLGFGRNVPMRELFAVFSDVEGIKEGSAVKMAGVDVGSVERVELQPNGTAILRFNVRKSVALPANVAAQVTASGLIGERFVALVPGQQTNMQGDAGLLGEGVTQLPVLASADPANISTDFAKMADDMKAITGSMKVILGDPENTQKFKEILDGLASFSNQLNNQGGTMQNLGSAAENLAKISEDLKNGKGALGQLLVADASGTTQQLTGTLQQLNAAVRDFREVMHKINSGQGTLGRLVNDGKTADKLDSALDSVNGVAGMFGGGGGAAASGGGWMPRAEGRLEAVNILGEDNVYSGGAAARLEMGNSFVDLGLQGDGFAAKSRGADNLGGPYYGKDFGSATKYTAQFGRYVGGNVAVRGGVKNSSAGVGVDAYGKIPMTDKNAVYSADFYDFGGNTTPGDDPHLDLTARADLIGQRVYGIVGYDNVLSEKYGGPMVGLGVRFQTHERGTTLHEPEAKPVATPSGNNL